MTIGCAVLYVVFKLACTLGLKCYCDYRMCSLVCCVLAHLYHRLKVRFCDHRIRFLVCCVLSHLCHRLKVRYCDHRKDVLSYMLCFSSPVPSTQGEIL